jgi:prefoldin subunit 5
MKMTQRYALNWRKSIRDQMEYINEEIEEIEARAERLPELRQQIEDYKALGAVLEPFDPPYDERDEE